MQSASFPPNEAQRLAKLRSYQIVDTVPEDFFDGIVKIAAQICQVPMAMISFVDAERQWFKAKQGIEMSSTPREYSFCAYTILDAGPFIVKDALNDHRFSDSPLVEHEPFVRFYVGIPLTTDDGYNIGSLCAMDTCPRELTFDQLSALRTLSQVVISQLELRKQRNEQELVQQRLKERTLEAERVTQMKSAFLANMSHEIRTPMNGVVGIAELLMNTALDAEQRELLETLHLSAISLLTLLNDILDSSKMEVGMLAIATQSVVLDEFLCRVERSFQPLAQAKKISFECVSSTQLPKTLQLDPARLQQILVNLIGNAVKFTPPFGSIVLTVKAVRGPRDAAFIQFEVSDTGIGVEEANQKLIFEPFVQGDSSLTRAYGGTGLGLSISSQLVRLMKGEIGVHSMPGQGSTFWFRVPALEGARADLHHHPAGAPGERLGPLLVLIAEDNAVNQRVARGLLEQQGHRVKIASTGAEAIDYLAQEQFDLILMDIHMPVMDGIEAVRIIRANEERTGGHIPIIALTANAMQGDREKYLSVGMDGYVPKPFTRAGLYSAIEELIGASEQEEEGRAEQLR